MFLQCKFLSAACLTADVHKNHKLLIFPGERQFTFPQIKLKELLQDNNSSRTLMTVKF